MKSSVNMELRLNSSELISFVETFRESLLKKDPDVSLPELPEDLAVIDHHIKDGKLIFIARPSETFRAFARDLLA